jgi:hypothetical protein
VSVGGVTRKFDVACDAFCAGVPLSITLIVNAKLFPAVLGVPVIAPVAVFKLSPPGKAPALTE